MKFSELVLVYNTLSSNSKRLSKIHHISNLLKIADEETLPMVILLLQGKVFISSDEEKLGIATNMALKAISQASGHSETEVMSNWKQTGDLGECAKLLFSKKKQFTLTQIELTIKKVFENLKKIAITSSKNANNANDMKVKLISELLTSATGDEAKYIIRLAVGDLRVGVGDGAFRDSLVWAYLAKEAKVTFEIDKKSDVVEQKDREQYNEICEKVMHAYQMTNDFTKVALALKREGLKGLEELKLEIFHPLQVMLCQKAISISNAFEKVGRPSIIEYKYDGFRVNIHKLGNKIELYTRRLEKVTNQFPDVIELFKDYKDDFILDAEIVGYDKHTKKYVAFQQISTRIRRKYDIEKQAEEIPVEVVCFDILYHNKTTLLDKKQYERRKILEKVIKEIKFKLVISKSIETSEDEEAKKFYDESLQHGNEGVIFKGIDKIYQPGSRVGFWVKYKPIMQELDLVIVKAEYGEGKRVGWYSSFTVGCITEDGEILEIGNVGTGIKEKVEQGVSFEELTNLLKPLIISEKKNEVTFKPQIVIEVAYEEIQKSTNYSSGYALRFPRLIRLRDAERSVESIDTLNTVEDLYFAQRGRG
ncbi:MAG: ATP-dependent DNA ligase [Candidatus Woesearchaeota archaeon]